MFMSEYDFARLRATDSSGPRRGAARSLRAAALLGGMLLVLFTHLALGNTGNAAKAGSGAKLLPRGYLSTRGNQIVDSHGRPVRIASVGWSGSSVLNQALDCMDNANYRAMMNAMVEGGFNCIRISWTDAELRSNVRVMSYMDYKKNPELAGLTQLEILDRVIEYAGKIRLKIILDHHVDEGLPPHCDQQQNGLWFDLGPGTDGTDGSGNRGTVTAQTFRKDWVTIAKRYAGNSTVIGFDLDNEPGLTSTNDENWGGGGPTDIWAMFTNVGNAIQTVNPSALIICEGAADDFTQGSLLWGRYNLSHVAHKPVVLNITNEVVYSVHEYPYEEAHRRPDSGPGYVKVMNAQWGFIVSRNIAPVWIGEMGAGLGPDDADGKAWIATLLPYINGQCGSLGGPTFHGNEQPISTDWWVWGVQTAGPHWGTLQSYDPIKFDPAEKAVTDELLYR